MKPSTPVPSQQLIRRGMLTVGVAAFAALLAGCFTEPNIKSGTVSCGTNHSCPSKLRCDQESLLCVSASAGNTQPGVDADGGQGGGAMVSDAGVGTDVPAASGGAGGAGGLAGAVGGRGGGAPATTGGAGGAAATGGGGGKPTGVGGAPSTGGHAGDPGAAGAGGNTACATSRSGVLAGVGCTCSAAGSLACSGNAQPTTLICSAGAWTRNETCSASKLCDSRPGSTVGTCQPIVPACAVATPGQLVCDASPSVVQCGPDLVTNTLQQACAGATAVCLNQACVACKPAATQSCGACNDGTATCDGTGAWGSCVGASPKPTYYRDVDNDGYGDVTKPLSLCGSAPSGYVANSTDCCDSDMNTHPTQTAFFTTQNACGKFDYDCDTVETTKASVLNASCTSTLVMGAACSCPSCYCNSTNGGAPVCGLTSCPMYSVTACGTSYIASGMGFDSTSCAPGAGGSVAGLQGCR